MFKILTKSDYICFRTINLPAKARLSENEKKTILLFAQAVPVT